MYSIAKNIKNLIDLNDLTFPVASAEIENVYNYLTEKDDHDNGVGLFSNLLFSAFGLIGEIDAIPAAPVIAWFVSAVVNKFSETTQPQLYNPFPQITSRYIATYLAIDTALTTTLNDLDNHLDDVYTIPDFINIPNHPKKTMTVRELANYDVPANYSDDFNKCKDAFVIGFRNELVKQELPRIGKYGIGCIYARNMGRYYIYIMSKPGSDHDRIYEWKDGHYTINSNDTQLQSTGHVVSVSGNSFGDFQSVAGKYCEQMGGALIVPMSNDGSTIQYRKYYMFTGYEEGEHSGWDLSPNDFYAWLFQDDGFGNIIRPDSIGKRDDIFRNWGITNGDVIPVALKLD